MTKNYAGRFAVAFPENPELFAAHLNQGDTAIERQAQDIIINHLPTFIYMDEHRSFEGNGAARSGACSGSTSRRRKTKHC